MSTTRVAAAVVALTIVSGVLGGCTTFNCNVKDACRAGATPTASVAVTASES